MDLEVEIPIWYQGKMKWISNLTSRSTCSDVIRAIVSSDSPESWENYYLYESWRGVERPLKARCRLLKLWYSWAGETGNVTLTLRPSQSQSNAAHFLLSQQEKKLRKLHRRLRRTDGEIEKFDVVAVEASLVSYVHLSRSIVDLQRQIEEQDKALRHLSAEIESEFHVDDFTSLLSDVNQTLIISRQLSEQSEELEEEIQRINEEIDRKQFFLDELELDDALEHNIDIDSLEDDEEEEEEDAPSPPLLPLKHKTGSSLLLLSFPSTLTLFSGLVPIRPTAIVEPHLSSDPSFSRGVSKCRVEVLSFPSRACSLSTNDESDTGISSFNSTHDEQLVTLV